MSACCARERVLCCSREREFARRKLLFLAILQAHCALTCSAVIVLDRNQFLWLFFGNGTNAFLLGPSQELRQMLTSMSCRIQQSLYLEWVSSPSQLCYALCSRTVLCAAFESIVLLSARARLISACCAHERVLCS